jgi:hypothetical protein
VTPHSDRDEVAPEMADAGQAADEEGASPGKAHKTLIVNQLSFSEEVKTSPGRKTVTAQQLSPCAGLEHAEAAFCSTMGWQQYNRM